MKTKILLVAFLAIGLTGIAQQRFTTKTGTLTFEASTANFEPVAAKNTSTSAILKEDGSLAVLALIKGFRFKKSLMEEHFNEKFMESDTYPKAKFTGKIENFDSQTLSDTIQEYVVKGTLSIHGVSQSVKSSIFIKKDSTGILHLSSKFSIAIADFNIAIKDKIAKKIAKTVNVALSLDLQ
ncbi:MAG: YceI family protein [Flavobacteriaceae bacterium]|nr:YceI family protein [Flavobacteriaceae bacterium]